MCTVKLKFLVVILTHLSSVHCKIEISSGHFRANESSLHCKIEIFSEYFTPWEQCALYKLKFLVIILTNERNKHCKIEISSCHFSPFEQCAL